MRSRLSSRGDLPIIGQTLHDPLTACFFSYSGFLIDLVAVPLLLRRRTQVVLVAFHFIDTRFFDIGILPCVTMAVTSIVFPPDRPRWLVGDLRQLSDPEHRCLPWRGPGSHDGGGLQGGLDACSVQRRGAREAADHARWVPCMAS
ncbi:MAG: HTTM domain-containing protein [Planctomycetota bacterium]